MALQLPKSPAEKLLETTEGSESRESQRLGALLSSGDQVGRQEELPGLPQFREAAHLFRGLCCRKSIKTDLSVITVVITYDSKHAVCLCADERLIHGQIQLFSLETFARKFVLDIRGKHVAMNEVEQNDQGDLLCVPFQDAGSLGIKVLSNTGQELANLDLNTMLKLDRGSKPIMGFFQPMITACFLPNDDLFINVFHRPTMMHHHLICSLSTKSITAGPKSTKLIESSTWNFPIKSFYHPDIGEVYTFYRQGHSITTKLHDFSAKVTQEVLTAADLGQMHLVFDHALVVRSSNSILFFKKIEGRWTEYHKLDNMRGTIFFMHFRVQVASETNIYGRSGNIRIQITTEEKIYFYLINQRTLMPELENVMFNFMKCSSLMFGARVRHGIAFKVNQPGFEIFTR